MHEGAAEQVEAGQTQNEDRVREQLLTRVGETLAGGWQLERLIDVGGMAGIFGATGADGRRVAVKLMRPEVAYVDALRDRFLLEAHILQRVNHPGTLQVIAESETADGEPFLVMELLEGESLEAYWKRKEQKLPFGEVLRLTVPVLSLLDACHKVGIVHADIKPSNMFLLKDGKVKVLDFGVSRVEWDGPQPADSSSVLGTPAYMAPEQAMGVDDLDPRADVFAVGATMFALLSGTRVNDGRTSDESFIIAATTPAPSLATVAPELPVDVVSVVNRSLAWDRRDRYQTADEMRTAVRALLERIDELQAEAEERALHGTRTSLAAFEGGLQDGEVEVPPALAEFFEQLDRTFRAVRTYGWGHSETARQHVRLFEGVRDSFAKGEDGLSWLVTPNTFEIEGAVLWEPDQPFDDIPYNLFVSGFRAIQLVAGVDESELVEFLRLMMLDPMADLAPEDDLSTLFLERNLEHIVVNLVSPLESLAVLEGHGALQDSYLSIEKEARESITDAMKSGLLSRDLDREADSMAVSVDQADAQGLAESRARALTLDKRDIESLKELLESPEETWVRRLPLVLAAAYEDAREQGDTQLVLEPFCEMVSRWINIGRFRPVLELYGDMCPHLDDIAGRKELAGRAFGDQQLRLIIDGICEMPAEAEVVRLGRGLFQLLSDLGERPLSLVLESLGQLRIPAIQTGLLNYTIAFLEGRENELGTLLVSCSEALGSAILEVLEGREGPSVLAALRRATSNPNEAVWRRALTLRLQRGTGEVLRDLKRLIAHRNPEIRAAVLDMVAEHDVRAISDTLFERISDAAFHALPIAERRKTLHATSSLDAARTEAVCVDILKRKGLVTNRTRDASRTVAAEILGKIGRTAGAVEALNNAVKARWWNSKELQTLAKDALTSVHARMSGGE